MMYCRRAFEHKPFRSCSISVWFVSLTQPLQFLFFHLFRGGPALVLWVVWLCSCSVRQPRFSFRLSPVGFSHREQTSGFCQFRASQVLKHGINTTVFHCWRGALMALSSKTFHYRLISPQNESLLCFWGDFGRSDTSGKICHCSVWRKWLSLCFAGIPELQKWLCNSFQTDKIWFFDGSWVILWAHQVCLCFLCFFQWMIN